MRMALGTVVTNLTLVAPPAETLGPPLAAAAVPKIMANREPTVRARLLTFSGFYHLVIMIFTSIRLICSAGLLVPCFLDRPASQTFRCTWSSCYSFVPFRKRAPYPEKKSGSKNLSKEEEERILPTASRSLPSEPLIQGCGLRSVRIVDSVPTVSRANIGDSDDQLP